jgi:UDP:flavonoid glycosyltransferase YjiC (YdhE family)
MRVMFTVSNWKAHYYCMVPLGWALQAAGHEVRMVCPPAQAEAISASGLLPVPVLDYVDLNYFARVLLYGQILQGEAPATPLPLHPETGEPVASIEDVDFQPMAEKALGEYVACMSRSYDSAVAFAEQWRPDLVIHDLVAEEGVLAARLQGVPVVYHTTGLIGTKETVAALERGPADISQSFGRYGQPAWSRDQVEYMIDPSPAAALPPVGDATRMPIRYVPYNGPGSVPPWLMERSDKRRVCIIWGNSANGFYGTKLPSLRHAVQAAADLGHEVVLTANDQQVDELGTLPDEVRVLRNFPVHLLLPGCDAVVHHGSANILLTAGVLGVPQLSLALTAEQTAISERMTATKAVALVSGLTGSGEEIAEAMRSVTGDPGFRHAAAALRDELAGYPTPAEVVRSLERLQAGHKP